MYYAYVIPDLVSVTNTEEQWSVTDTRRAAGQDFDRARRRALLRRITRPFMRVSPVGPLGPYSAEAGKSFALPLGCVTGLVLPDGRLSLGLPPLPRRLQGAWLKAYGRMIQGEVEGGFAFRVNKGGWYLEGGAEALLRLEILRARGETSVSATIAGERDLRCCEADGEGEGDRLAC
jgi:hypothetical protein